MSSIDLIILGMLMEKSQSAYEIQKDVEAHHLSRWTKISVPSVYKKVLQLKEKGYLESQSQKGSKFAEKAVYSITPAGRGYFTQLMEECASQPVSLLLDFNVLVANLNKVEKAKGLQLLQTLEEGIGNAARANAQYTQEYANIPLVGATIFQQQQLVYGALQEWVALFKGQFEMS